MKLFAFFIPFVVYLKTLSPSVELYDAGDMITSAALLGIPHPPGYPFYCLLGKVWLYIFPFGNIAYRINMLSAIFGSLASLFVYLIVQRITSSIMPSIISSLILAFSYTVWQQSTFAGQYIGHLTLSLLLIFLLLKSSKKYLYLFFFFLSLSFAHHRQTLFILFGAFVLFTFQLAKSIFGKYKGKQKFLIKPYLINVGISFILFLIPLFLYLYLPIRASTNPPLNWTDPDTIPRFISHIKGEQYGFLFRKLSLKEHISRMIEEIKYQFSNQFPLFYIILGIFGLFLMAIFSRFVFLLLFSIIFVNSAASSSYGHPSIELYYMLPFAILSIQMGYCLFHIGKVLKKIYFLFFLFGIFLPLFLFFKNYPLVNKSRDYAVYDYGMNILRPVAKNAAIFVSDDTHTFPLIYLHYAEKAREDILLIDTHLLQFEWKANLIKEQFSNLPFDLWPSALRKEIVTYDEVSWERQKDMIEKNMAYRQFYIFPHPLIAQFYEFLPEGVFSRILKKNIGKEEIFLLLNKTRFNFKIRRPSHNVYMINYAISHYNRARLYYNIGMYKEGLNEINKAIKIYPGKYEAGLQLKRMLEEKVF